MQSVFTNCDHGFMVNVLSEEGWSYSIKVRTWDMWVQLLGLACTSCLTFAKLYALFVSGVKWQW